MLGPEVDRLRQEFETYAKGPKLPLERDGLLYAEYMTQLAWMAYRAGANNDAGLREEIDRLQQAHERIGDILLPLVDTPDETSVGCAENAAKELTKLRAKLADITKALENMTPGGSEFHDSPNNCLAFIKDRMATVVSQVKARRAAEAEAAALRERERAKKNENNA